MRISYRSHDTLSENATGLFIIAVNQDPFTVCNVERSTSLHCAFYLIQRPLLTSSSRNLPRVKQQFDMGMLQDNIAPGGLLLL